MVFLIHLTITPPSSSADLIKSNLILFHEQTYWNSENALLWNLNQNFLREIIIMGVPFPGGTPKSPWTYPNAVNARRYSNFFLNYCKTLIHVMQLTKGSSHYTTMSAINLHRPISNTTGINTETHTENTTNCLFSHRNYNTFNIQGGGVMQLIEWENRTARKQEDWKSNYLHSALNTCINKFVHKKLKINKLTKLKICWSENTPGIVLNLIGCTA